MDPYNSIVIVGGKERERTSVTNKIRKVNRNVIGQFETIDELLEVFDSIEPNSVILLSNSEGFEMDKIRDLYAKGYVDSARIAIIGIIDEELPQRAVVARAMMAGVVRKDELTGDRIDKILVDYAGDWRQHKRAVFIEPSGNVYKTEYGTVQTTDTTIGFSDKRVSDLETGSEIIISDRTGDVYSSYDVGELSLMMNTDGCSIYTIKPDEN